MQAFVTGATGLLGNNLVRALEADGHRVRALVRSVDKARALLGDTSAELVAGDMADVAGFADALHGCDAVFHTAAYFREYFREYYRAGRHWPQFEAINVRGAEALAGAALARGVRRFIDTSTSALIGVTDDGRPGDESTPPAALAYENLYVKSKLLAAERLLDLTARTDLEVVQVLPGWMFGPRDAGPTASGRLVRDFLAQALPGTPPGGTNVVDARDVARGMIRAAERGRRGERYILGGAFATLQDVMQGLARASGLPAPRRRIPYPAALAYAMFAQTWARLTGGETLISVASVHIMRAEIRVSSAKAERELDWRPRPLLATLRDEVAWYRAHDAAATVMDGRPATSGAAR